jgi:hypothetical protein
MTDWKSVGIGALVNVVLTMVLALVMFPLFFLGPVIGGLLTTYLAEENLVNRRNPTAGASDGALSGVIGGLIIGLIFILGFGALSAIIGLVFTQIGAVAGTITLITGMFITLISVFLGGILGAIGGVIGVSIREKESVHVEVIK